MKQNRIVLPAVLGLLLLMAWGHPVAALTKFAQNSEDPTGSRDSSDRGRALLRKSIAAAGGANHFEKMRTVSRKGTIKLKGPAPRPETSIDFRFLLGIPDRLRLDIELPTGNLSQILNGEQAWIVQGSSTQQTAQGAELATVM